MLKPLRKLLFAEIVKYAQKGMFFTLNIYYLKVVSNTHKKYCPIKKNKISGVFNEAGTYIVLTIM